jgi:hypothetical protein
MSVVIDTNVPIVANGHHEEASLRCIEACIDALMQARSGPVLVDDGYLIFEEYRRHLLQAGQPGLGDAFFRWLWDNQANPACCRQITIVPDQLGYRVFEEFPDDPELAGFDRSDQRLRHGLVGSSRRACQARCLSAFPLSGAHDPMTGKLH